MPTSFYVWKITKLPNTQKYVTFMNNEMQYDRRRCVKTKRKKTTFSISRVHITISICNTMRGYPTVNMCIAHTSNKYPLKALTLITCQGAKKLCFLQFYEGRKQSRNYKWIWCHSVRWNLVFPVISCMLYLQVLSTIIKPASSPSALSL